jgi:hypothetical protein
MSMAFAVVVLDKVAAPPGNLNEPPAKATVLPAVASLVKMSVNEDAPVATGKRSVMVALPVSVAEKTPPDTTSRFIAVPVLPKQAGRRYCCGRTTP